MGGICKRPFKGNGLDLCIECIKKIRNANFKNIKDKFGIIHGYTIKIDAHGRYLS